MMSSPDHDELHSSCVVVFSRSRLKIPSSSPGSVTTGWQGPQGMTKLVIFGRISAVSRHTAPRTGDMVIYNGGSRFVVLYQTTSTSDYFSSQWPISPNMRHISRFWPTVLTVALMLQCCVCLSSVTLYCCYRKTI